MGDRAEFFGKRSIEKQTPVRQHVKGRVRQPFPASRDQLQKTVAQKSRFAARDPELLRRRIDEIDQSKMLGQTVGIVDRLRRLRTHQAKAVALLRSENEV